MKRRTIIKSLAGLFYGARFLVKQVKASGTLVFSQAWEKGRKIYAGYVSQRVGTTYKCAEDVEKRWDDCDAGKQASILDDPSVEVVGVGWRMNKEGNFVRAAELIIFKDIPGPKPYDV